MTCDEAFAELRACSGTQFMPEVVEALINGLTREQQKEQKAVTRQEALQWLLVLPCLESCSPSYEAGVFLIYHTNASRLRRCFLFRWPVKSWLLIAVQPGSRERWPPSSVFPATHLLFWLKRSGGQPGLYHRTHRNSFYSCWLCCNTPQCWYSSSAISGLPAWSYFWSAAWWTALSFCQTAAGCRSAQYLKVSALRL